VVAHYLSYWRGDTDGGERLQLIHGNEINTSTLYHRSVGEKVWKAFIKDQQYSRKEINTVWRKPVHTKKLFQTRWSALCIDRKSMQVVQHHVIYSPERNQPSQSRWASMYNLLNNVI
jgi:hypothetical protein